MNEDLLERYCRDRSSVAFDCLAERYSPLIHSVCRRYLRNAHDVDDATQETLLRLARSGTGITGSVTAWLTTTAYTCSIDIIRREQSEKRRRLVAASIGSAHTQHHVLHDAIRRRVHEALLNLDSCHRELVVARFLKKEPLRLLAARAGVSVGTMSRRTTAAMEALAEVLRDMGIDAVDTLTLAEHFGDACNYAEPLGRSTETLRFAPDWNSPELVPQGVSGPAPLIDGWSRAIRVGVMVSYATLSTFSTHIQAFVPVFDQVRSAAHLPRSGVQLVGIVEPATDHIGVIESTLREYDLLGGLIRADDAKALATLDVILLGNNFRMDPPVARAVFDAVSGGVGLLNERWTANSVQQERDPVLRSLMLSATAWHPYHSPDGCATRHPAIVCREHPLLKGLSIGSRLQVAACGPAYHIAPGAELLIVQEQCVLPSSHAMTGLGDLPLPTCVVGQIGLGRAFIIQAWPHDSICAHLSISAADYFANLLQWLAEPRRRAS